MHIYVYVYACNHHEKRSHEFEKRKERNMREFLERKRKKEMCIMISKIKRNKDKRKINQTKTLTTLRFHLIPVTVTAHAGKDVGNGENLLIADGRAIGAATVGNSVRVPQKAAC